MHVMTHYFEPQILYGIARPNLCGDVRPRRFSGRQIPHGSIYPPC